MARFTLASVFKGVSSSAIDRTATRILSGKEGFDGFVGVA
jgi:hypothetical protein